MNTFDIVLLYHTNPEILSNWFHRLIYHSDYLKFINRSHIIIADTGSPWDTIESNLDVVRKQPKDVREKVIYARCNTDEIRKQVPEGVSARPQCHGYNMAFLDISKADLVIGSIIGHVFTPRYFEGHLVEHMMNKKACVLPKRFDLICPEYHTKWFDKPWNEIKQNFELRPSGGWPDFSLKRQYIVDIGGWDEWYTFISPADMDFGSRLTGKVDNGLPSQFLFPQMGHFNNLGLDFVQPYKPDFASVACSNYKSHQNKENPERVRGHELGNVHYLENWGKVVRNENRIPTDFKIWTF
jgi:hypothetical protein